MKNFFKVIGGTVLVMVALAAVAQTIQWYSQQPATTSLLDSDTMVAERAAPQSYRSFTLLTFKDYIGTNGPTIVYNNFQFVTNQQFYYSTGIVQYVTNQYVTYSTNTYQYVTNQYVTFNTNNYSYVTNEYVTYSTNLYEYTTNQFVTYNTNVYSYVTNEYVTTNFTEYSYVTNLYVSNFFATNTYFEFLTNNYQITTNLNVKNLTIIEGSYFTTNGWAGAPTGAVQMHIQDQYVRTYTPLSITGITQKSNTVVEPVVMTITNAAASNITVYLASGITIPDRTSSFTVSNGSWGIFSLRYHPNAGTNGIYKQW